MTVIGKILFVLLVVSVLLAFFITAVCFSHPRAIIKYDGELSVYARLWFVKINALRFAARKRKKKVKKLHFDVSDGVPFGEALPEKSKKAKKKAESPAPKKAGSQAKKAKKPITETLSLITDILSDIKEPIKKTARVKIDRLYLVAGSSDASDTAIMFGHMNTLAGTLLHLCDDFAFCDINENYVGVYSDFLAEKPKSDIQITVIFSTRHILACGFKALMRYIREK